MPKYEVDCLASFVVFIEAVDADTAEDTVISNLEEEYGLAPGQVYLDEIKEVNI